MKACRNCKYFIEIGVDKNEGYGECRRYPPTVNVNKDYDVFPWGHRTNWCGEFVIAEDRVSVGEGVKGE